MVHEQMVEFLKGFRRDAHPMAIMCGLVGALSSFYHDSLDITNENHRRITAHRLISKMPTLAAMAYKHSIGQPFVYPNNELSYGGNFLHMMFSTPCEDYHVNPVLARAMDKHLPAPCRPRTERLHLHGASGGLQWCQSVRLYRRRYRRPVGTCPRRCQRGRAEDAG